MAQFINWFLVRSPAKIVRIGHNFLLWGWQFFSIGYFLPRIFAPWHRDITGYGRGFDLKRFFHALGWNLISRFIGAVMRLVVMGVGLIAEGLIFVAGVLVLFGWYLLPFIIPFLFAIGFLTFRI